MASVGYNIVVTSAETKVRCLFLCKCLPFNSSKVILLRHGYTTSSSSLAIYQHTIQSHQINFFDKNRELFKLIYYVDY